MINLIQNKKKKLKQIRIKQIRIKKIKTKKGKTTNRQKCHQKAMNQTKTKNQKTLPINKLKCICAKNTHIWMGIINLSPKSFSLEFLQNPTCVVAAASRGSLRILEYAP